MYDGRRKAGGRRQKAGGKRQEAGGRRKEEGGRRQEAGSRRQEAGGGRQEKADGRRQKGRLASSFVAALAETNECPVTHCRLTVQEKKEDSSCPICQKG